MLKKHILYRGDSTVYWIVAAILVLSLLLPIVAAPSVYAAQITARSVTIDKSNTSASDVEWDFAYTLPNTAGEKEGLRYLFCTTPLPTDSCTAPSGMNVGADSVTSDAQTGWPSNATSWTEQTADEGACTAATNSTYELCFQRTTAAATGGGAVTHTISGITAPNSNDTVYVRIYTYGVDDFTGLQDQGTVAAAFVNQLTLTAKVQENLEFCVGDNDGGSNSDCSDITGSTVDIGVIDFVTPRKSSTNSGVAAGDKNGYVMVRTNGSGGLNIDYFGGDTSGNLVSGSNTIAPKATQGALSAGTEAWGMEVDGAVVDSSNGGGGGPYLTLDANFDADDQAYWGATSTTLDDLANSTSVVDDDLLVLDFHGSAAITTPTGVYTTTITFIATPTF